MAWIRDMRVTAPATFTSTVAPLTEHLSVALTRTSGVEAADIHAHIGHAYFLRHRDGARGLEVEAEFAAALALDATNPFAHAMWGLWNASQRRSLEAVTDRFRLALASGRERAYVQRVRLASLDWLGTTEANLERLRVADEMRRNREPLEPERRYDIARDTYPRSPRDAETKLPAVLPPADHLATYRWLIEGLDLKQQPVDAYYLARLTEAAGDRSGAAALYRPLATLDTTFQALIAAGLTRCATPAAP